MGHTCSSLCPIVYCSSAMYFKEWSGTTRSSWSAVSSKSAGYWTPLSGFLMLWSGEYLGRKVTEVSWVMCPQNVMNSRAFAWWRHLTTTTRMLWGKLLYSVFFLSKNRSCATQICITKTTAKCILVVVANRCASNFMTRSWELRRLYNSYGELVPVRTSVDLRRRNE